MSNNTVLRNVFINDHVLYLLRHLQVNPQTMGLIIHPDVEVLRDELVKRFTFIAATIRDIRLSNGSHLILSDGNEGHYKSVSFDIVYIHEVATEAQVANLKQHIPAGGLIMTRIS